MKQFDLEKYESIFFNLLEGNYSKQEEKTILEEIEANAFLNFEWKNWQKAMLEDEAEAYAAENSAFFDALKDDADAVNVVPVWSRKRVAAWLPYAGIAAACLLVVLMFTVNLNKNRMGVPEFVETENPASVSPIPTDTQASMVPIQQEVAVQPSKSNIGQNGSSEVPAAEIEIIPIPVPEEAVAYSTREEGDQKDGIEIDLDVDETVIEDNELVNPIIASTTTIPPAEEIVEEPVIAYQVKFTVTKEKVDKRDIVLSQKELSNMNVRKLLENKRIKLVNIGNKTYVRLESPDQETVLVGLSQ